MTDRDEEYVAFTDVARRRVEQRVHDLRSMVKGADSVPDGLGLLAATLAVANRLDRVGDLLNEHLISDLEAIEIAEEAGPPCASGRVIEWDHGEPSVVRWCDRRSGPCPYAGTGMSLDFGAGRACAVQREADFAVLNEPIARAKRRCTNRGVPGAPWPCASCLAHEGVDA